MSLPEENIASQLIVAVSDTGRYVRLVTTLNGGRELQAVSKRAVLHSTRLPNIPFDWDTSSDHAFGYLYSHTETDRNLLYKVDLRARNWGAVNLMYSGKQVYSVCQHSKDRPLVAIGQDRVTLTPEDARVPTALRTPGQIAGPTECYATQNGVLLVRRTQADGKHETIVQEVKLGPAPTIGTWLEIGGTAEVSTNPNDAGFSVSLGEKVQVYNWRRDEFGQMVEFGVASAGFGYDGTLILVKANGSLRFIG